ncbi:MAG: BolA family transcriptional regulator [Pelagibacterales bacterium]|nr:BolA family transcriptional regulator [Pelagibacterales bacterium]OUU61577.1 MAG: hypothetical protein CBC22_07360 [Alphaproteobacteria bacterium TMED62]|tara:strand:- start:12224 stop:12496 length:273 start_codon:yes stop_codon:yes gene_type:complete
MNRDSRKERIEKTLQSFFSPKLLIVRDDSKKHEGHNQIGEHEKETHFYIQMRLNDHKTTNKVNLHRKVYSLLNSEFSSGLHALELDIKSI